MTRRQQIAALVGEEAAAPAYRANAWLLRAVIAAFPTLPVLGALATLLHMPLLWLVGAATLLVSIGCFIPGARLNRQAGRVASEFLARREGSSIVVKSGGIRPWGWRKEIERAHRRLNAEQRQRERQATSDLQNQQWLDQRQRKWDEYRSKHPQGRA